MSRKDEWLREGIREVREASSSHLVQQSTGGIGSRASCTKGRGERGGVGLSAGVGVAYCLKKAGASDSREEEKDSDQHTQSMPPSWPPHLTLEVTWGYFLCLGTTQLLERTDFSPQGRTHLPVSAALSPGVCSALA